MDLFVDEKASSVKLLKLVIKNIILIVVFSIIGAALGAGITFFIPKKYYAFAVIFPSNNNLGLNVMEDPRFGNSIDADQLMQLLDSRQLKDSIIQMYKLDEYYEIDKSEKSWRQKLERKYISDIGYNKTRYYSVVITAKLKDPELCANIVNSIIELVDVLRYKIIRENQVYAFQYAVEQFNNQKVLVDSLKAMIYSKKEMSNPDNILYNHMLENGKINYINPSPFVTTPELETLTESYVFEQQKLINLKGDYHKAQRLIEKPLSKVFVVSKAVPNYKKLSPSFLLNAVIGFIGALVFAFLFVLIRDRFSSIKQLLKD